MSGYEWERVRMEDYEMIDEQEREQAAKEGRCPYRYLFEGRYHFHEKGCDERKIWVAPVERWSVRLIVFIPAPTVNAVERKLRIYGGDGSPIFETTAPSGVTTPLQNLRIPLTENFVVSITLSGDAGNCGVDRVRIRGRGEMDELR